MITGKLAGDTAPNFCESPEIYSAVRGLPKIHATKTETT